MKNLSVVLIVALGCFAFGCASVPVPPTLETIHEDAKKKGPEQTYEHYKVDITGDAFFGHTVTVNGEKAPARAYLNEAAFDVPHMNGWASVVGSILAGVSGVAAITALVMLFMPPVALVIAVCALPPACIGLGFSLYGNWDMMEAGAAYNERLKQEIDKAAGKGSRKTTSQNTLQPGDRLAVAPALAY